VSQAFREETVTFLIFWVPQRHFLFCILSTPRDPSRTLRSECEQGEGSAPAAAWREPGRPFACRRVRECYTFTRVKHYWCCMMSNKSRRLVSRTVEQKEKSFPNSFTVVSLGSREAVAERVL